MKLCRFKLAIFYDIISCMSRNFCFFFSIKSCFWIFRGSISLLWEKLAGNKAPLSKHISYSHLSIILCKLCFSWSHVVQLQEYEPYHLDLSAHGLHTVCDSSFVPPLSGKTSIFAFCSQINLIRKNWSPFSRIFDFLVSLFVFKYKIDNVIFESPHSF